MKEIMDLNSDMDSPAISWSAVIGGAFVTAALSLALLALGAGFGLLSVSPWSRAGASAANIDAAAIIWLLVNEVVASSAGGYLAGRLRTNWSLLHSDEVYFRDTAHGFLAWAVAVVISAAFLGSAATAMVGSSTVKELPSDYFVDKLFRSSSGTSANSNSTADETSVRSEVAAIMAHSIRDGKFAAADRTYLTQLVSQKTGLSEDRATQRIAEVTSEAQQAVDLLRKATARLLLWIFLALLLGAFCASYAGTVGGRHRDLVKAA